MIKHYEFVCIICGAQLRQGELDICYKCEREEKEQEMKEKIIKNDDEIKI